MTWICHYITKFGTLFALPSKEAIEVANVLSTHMVILGVPVILQADNGKGFKGAVLQLAKNQETESEMNEPIHPMFKVCIYLSGYIVNQTDYNS